MSDSKPTIQTPVTHLPRQKRAGWQDILPAKYGFSIQGLSLLACAMAFVGWLNEAWFYGFESPIWLNRYTEYVIILVFGIWRIRGEQNPYTKKRLMVLVGVVTVFWWLIPWLMPTFEPYIGYVWNQPVFPAIHTPGTITFFLVLSLVLLFGRRVVCGWGCPCVGIRETVGFAFRDRTLRGKWAWRLRHSKWFFFVIYMSVLVVTMYPPNAWSVRLVGIFYLILALTYFGSFFLMPITGNRFYCRHICPFGATFGLLNHYGLYDIKLDNTKCIACKRCEQVCDMGIPVQQQGHAFGHVMGLEDCMGCVRCVVACPTNALEVRDVRNLFRPNLHQNADYLLKRADAECVQNRSLLAVVDAPRDRSWIMQQASRCLDCGEPGCRNSCPLQNRIPDWLQLAAQGSITEASALAHETNPFPEICGRLCPQERLCERNCSRTKLEGAVMIGAIEAAISDLALANGWMPEPFKARPKPHQIAVIGAGPSGLACAQRLCQNGFSVTVFDRNPAIGGILQTVIPTFKLDRAILTRRQEILEKMGVVFQLNREIDPPMMQRIVQDFQFIYLATGAQKPKQIDLPGEQLAGVWQAMAFLAKVKKQELELSGKRVLVIGGGDTAMDSVRSAILHDGTLSVQVAYRRSQELMRATVKEQQAAREEGAIFHFDHRPKRVMGENQVRGVQFETASGVVELPADLVILAFGQMPAPPSWLQELGVKTDVQGLIQVDANGWTSNPKVYAGGDNTHGPDLVVTALAAGLRAADQIVTQAQRQKIPAVSQTSGPRHV